MIDKAGTVADVKTLATARDSGGGITESYNTRLGDEPVRIRALSGNEIKQLGADRVVSTHRMYFKIKDTSGAEMVINEKDRIVVKNSAGKTLGTFDLGFVDNPHELDKFIQVDATQRV